VAGHDFLRQLNIECQKGYDAIQCHRTAKNSNNHIAALDGVSEEINNTLFRKAHNIIGLSSALIGSGMCFNYQWFSQHVSCLNSAVEDRELEALLMQQGIFIKYADKLLVMDEKVCSHDNFQRQRLRWMTGQLQALLSMLPYLPTAFLKGNINYIDKTIQQMLIPRSILLVLIPVIALLITFVSITWSVKWWLMLICFSVALFIATPSKLRTRSLLSSLIALPRLVWRMLSNIGHMDRNNTDFIHTSHGADNK
jgi:cellulose synthase/poly-beta-1,6-N-acetylglucosamine synthase-like glycosyltransferase